MDGKSSSTNLTTEPKCERGFTLIEMIVTVAIIGILAGMATMVISGTLKRQRVDVTAQDLRSFLQSAQQQASRTRSTVFVRINLAATRMEITADAAGATVLDTWPVPESMSLSSVAIGGVESNWPLITATVIQGVGCTPTGLCVDPNTGRQVTAIQTIRISHNEMITGDLGHAFRYELRIFPLWNTVADKQWF